MLNSVADLITIVSYGNEYLNHGGKFDWHVLGLQNRPVFRDGGFDSDIILARDVEEWYAYLKNGGCKKVRMFYKPSGRQSISEDSLFLDESITWVIETVYEGRSDYWESKWINVSNCWDGDYYRTASNQPVIDKQKDLENIRQKLEDKLKKVSALEYDSFGSDYFDKNIKILNSSANGHEFWPIIEKNYGQLARRIFNAAFSSWCFTGMGSWADESFSTVEVQREAQEITKELFYAVCDAYVYAVNSY